MAEVATERAAERAAETCVGGGPRLIHEHHDLVGRAIEREAQRGAGAVERFEIARALTHGFIRLPGVVGIVHLCFEH